MGEENSFGGMGQEAVEEGEEGLMSRSESSVSAISTGIRVGVIRLRAGVDGPGVASDVGIVGEGGSVEGLPAGLEVGFGAALPPDEEAFFGLPRGRFVAAGPESWSSAVGAVFFGRPRGLAVTGAEAAASALAVAADEVLSDAVVP